MKRVASLPIVKHLLLQEKEHIHHAQAGTHEESGKPAIVKHLLLQEKAGNFFIAVQPVVVANVPPPHVDGTVKEGGQEAGPAVCGQRQQSGTLEAVGLGAHHSLTLKGSAMNSLSL